MIKVTIELYPYGDAETKREISSFYIANSGTGNAAIGNYLFREKETDKWEPSIQGWERWKPVEQLVQKVIEKHYVD